MPNTKAQKENERFILDKFFSVMGIKAESIQKGQEANGNPQPDFVACIAGKQIGIEETTHYREQRPDELQPRQAKEKAWHDLQRVIEDVRQNYSELSEVHGVIKFRNFTLPSLKEHRPFVNELVDFTMNKLDVITHDRKRFKTFNEKHSLLNKYVEYLELQRIKYYKFWDWTYNAEYVGLQKDTLRAIIQSKINQHINNGEHIKRQVDENWLLITTGTQLSQQVGHLFVERLNQYEEVNKLLNTGPFAKVYFYDYMNSRVILWTIQDMGWVSMVS